MLQGSLYYHFDHFSFWFLYICFVKQSNKWQHIITFASLLFTTENLKIFPHLFVKYDININFHFSNKLHHIGKKLCKNWMNSGNLLNYVYFIVCTFE